MDMYGNKVTFAQAAVSTQVVYAPRVAVPRDIGPFGCVPCTSGDSPIWDNELIFLGGY